MRRSIDSLPSTTELISVLGPIKTLALRGIKESPPYLHDGRCLTLEDTVEFFNLVLALHLTPRKARSGGLHAGPVRARARGRQPSEASR